MAQDLSTKDLEAPEGVASDGDAFEILTVWVSDKSMYANMRAGVWDDPRAWGVTLSNMAAGVADAYRSEHGLDYDETFRKIKEGIEEGLKNHGL